MNTALERNQIMCGEKKGGERCGKRKEKISSNLHIDVSLNEWKPCRWKCVGGLGDGRDCVHFMTTDYFFLHGNSLAPSQHATNTHRLSFSPGIDWRAFFCIATTASQRRRQMRALRRRRQRDHPVSTSASSDSVYRSC